MALQGSGAISLSQIRAEFGGSAPDSISEYYGADTGVPASGTISFSDFYGTAAGPTETLRGSSTYAGTYTFIDDNISFDVLGIRDRTAVSGDGQSSKGGFIYINGNNTYYPAVLGDLSSYFNTSTFVDGKFRATLNGSIFCTFNSPQGNWSTRNVNGTNYTILTQYNGNFQTIDSGDTWKFEWFNLS